MQIAVLFARRDSVYKSIPGCDVYDIDRDARTFTGTAPVVAHPPCRAWGKLRAFAKPRPDEKDLALFAVDVIRRNGGVLEHPEGSTLWNAAGLPLGTARDEWGGFTLSVDQFWWGHKIKKSTWLYVVGIEPSELPPIPLKFDAVFYSFRKRSYHPLPEITRAEREHTPLALALWLVELARMTKQTIIA